MGLTTVGSGNERIVFLRVIFLILENRDLERNVILGYILYMGEIACKRVVLQFCIIMKHSARVSSSGSGIKFLM